MNEISPIVERPAPWSPAARDSLEAGRSAIDGLADSLAQQRLAQEIKRYVHGQVSGRAFLVAGHRGAGKTTAVLAAMQQVYNECWDDDSTQLRRPLLVRLHAPSLLVESQPGSAAESPATSRTATDGSTTRWSVPRPASNVEPSVRHSTRFLQEMAAGIFPALVDELRRLLPQRVAEVAATGTLEVTREHREMIAHICEELSRGMTPGELRELFRRLGLLSKSLLGNVDVFQELVAIHAASEAYLIVTGKLETKQDAGAQSSATAKAESNTSVDGDRWVKALTPVSAALALAAGVASDSLAAGVIVACGVLLSGLSFSWSTSRALSRTAAMSRSFQRDNSHESLIRHVPLLVEQLRAIGLPVVFVLDELDKLEQPKPEELLNWLMRNLKSYVTERSFLCFVVERKYYERVFGLQAGANADTDLYGVEHTFYSDAAYVVATQAALHDYLRLVLGEAGASDTEPQLAIFRHVLIHRARVHTYDLQRELRRAIASGELHSIATGGDGFRTPLAWTYSAFFECCIEWISSESRLRRRSLEDAYFAQLEQDLLYDVSRGWRSAEPIDLTVLRQRAANAAAADRPLLEYALNALVAYLQEPASLLKSIQDELDLGRLEVFLCSGEREPGPSEQLNARTEISQTIGLKGRDPQQLGKFFASTKYRVLRSVTRGQVCPLFDATGATWLVDPRGNSRSDANLAEADLDRIEDLQSFRLHLETENLLKGLQFSRLWNVAMTSLPWTQLEAALRDKDSKPGDPDVRDAIERFAEDVPAACQLVVLLLAGVSLADTIRKAAGKTQPEHETALEQLARGILGTALETRSASAAHLVHELATRHGLVLSQNLSGLVDELRRPPDQRTGDWKLDRVAAVFDITGTPASDLRAVRADWLEHVASRVWAALDGQIAPVTIEEQGARLDVIAVLNGWFSPALLPLWRLFARPNDWTITMCSSLLEDPDAVATPAWIRAFAAAKLGLREPAEELLQAARSAQPSSAIAKICDHAGKLLIPATVDAPRALLVNPGRVMRSWLPIPGIVAVSARNADVISVAAAGHYEFIFTETEASRPSSLLRDQFIIVRPAPPTRPTPPWTRQSDETLVLFGPESLLQAIEWFRSARPTT